MKRISIHPPSRPTKLFLRIALTLCLLSSIALLISYLDARREWVAMANLFYRPLLEYILAALAVTSVGVVLIEAVLRDAE